jgi:hypothetical protein
MKFYESHYEEYIHAVDIHNIHPELKPIFDAFPKKLQQFDNLIIYGASGIGKYSQALYLLKKYSPSELKYEKKITCQTDKQSYIYHISDIHYEIDISLLGCNSKLLMHEIFFQIVDIVSVKTDKFGIIVCKNFHMIHNELLEIFYSYIQQYNHPSSHIQIKFILLTEHVSFIPNNIVNACKTISISRPSKFQYMNIGFSSNDKNISFLKRIHNYKHNNNINKENIHKIMNSIDNSFIINTKEMKSFNMIKNLDELPKDNFNTICNNIIHNMEMNSHQLSFIKFRDDLYDILIYNLDVVECIWHVLHYFIHHNKIAKDDIHSILDKMHIFLKHYNNNYRPIYHLENIFYYIITKIQTEHSV